MVNNSSFKRGLKNLSWLSLGLIVSKIIRFSTFVFIANSLGTGNYGIYVACGAFSGMFSFIRFEGLDRVLLRASSEDVSNTNLQASKISGVKMVFSFLAIIATCLFAFFSNTLTSDMKIFVLLFSLQHLDSSISGIFRSILQANERMQIMSLVGILRTLFFGAFTYTVLTFDYSIFELILVLLLSHFLALIIYYIYLKRMFDFKLFHYPKFNLKILKPAFTFSLIGYLGFLTTRVDLVMLLYLSSQYEVGIYAVAFKLHREMAKVRAIVSNSFFPLIVKRISKGPIKLFLVYKYFAIIFLSMIVLSTVLSLISDYLIYLLFDNSYKESGEILKVLFFQLIFGFSTLPFTNLLIATHNEKYLLYFGFITALMNIPLNYLLYLEYGLIGFAYSTLIVALLNFTMITLTSVLKMREQGHLV
jgi:O-antigen/teichoic acid export membrane protein